MELGKRKHSQPTLDEYQAKRQKTTHSSAGDGGPVSMVVSQAKKNVAVAGKPRPPSKKLVIKPFKVKPSLPADFEEATWQTLKAAVDAIHKGEPVSTSLEELYRMCENLCAHKMAANLSTRLEKTCQAHVRGTLRRLTGQTSDPKDFLPLVDACWREHCSQMILIRQIFLVLDRTYVMQNANVRSLWDMGLLLFRQHIMSDQEVSRKTVEGLLAMVASERAGEMVNRALLLSLTRMFEALQIYGEVFEGPFLAATKQFYRTEGEMRLAEVDVPTYLNHVSTRLAEEGDRVSHYLDGRTRRPLVQVVEHYMVEVHVPVLISRGFDSLMDESRKTDLALMYSLCARVDATAALKTAFGAYIKARGGEIVQDETKDSTMVEALLAFRARVSAILKDSFQGNEAFTYALKESFEYFINRRQNKPAELIAKFIDSKLKSSGHKGSSEAELEATLDAVMVLFRHISGKDVFEAFYKKDLARRLLLQKSASFDAEKSMISKLKAECGSSFTNKLEGMFKDIDLSSDIMASYGQQATGPGAIELQVSVLTMGYWPAYPEAPVILPSHLAELQENFKTFYLSKHNGRRLTWQNSLGTCLVRAEFPKGRKDLVVSLFQAVVLLHFSDVDTLSFADIKQKTGIEDAELRRTLQSLACGKQNARVLLKRPKGRDVLDGDVFHFNAGLKNNLIRIKINQIQLKETAEENEQTNERVFQDRQYQIDAALVRIMKTRKTLSHAGLMAECKNQLKFPLESGDVKKRIESLIDREYMARDPSNAAHYNYLA